MKPNCFLGYGWDAIVGIVAAMAAMAAMTAITMDMFHEEPILCSR